ncbi:hypothetical protein PG985_009958 [Apiospora marii]|uniref:uncharacterized protein n=1 Tax=Apiospora marii TaxID=335849 RepID=UPI00312EB628
MVPHARRDRKNRSAAAPNRIPGRGDPLSPLRLYALAAGLLAATAHASSCNQVAKNDFSHFAIEADGVGDVPGICGGLWDNLHHSHMCEIMSEHSCEETAPGHLTWKFAVYGTCKNGMVESAWWEATKNRFGAIDCVTDCSRRGSGCDPHNS